MLVHYHTFSPNMHTATPHAAQAWTSPYLVQSWFHLCHEITARSLIYIWMWNASTTDAGRDINLWKHRTRGGLKRSKYVSLSSVPFESATPFIQDSTYIDTSYFSVLKTTKMFHIPPLIQHPFESIETVYLSFFWRCRLFRCHSCSISRLIGEFYSYKSSFDVPKGASTFLAVVISLDSCLVSNCSVDFCRLPMPLFPKLGTGTRESDEYNNP